MLFLLSPFEILLWVFFLSVLNFFLFSVLFSVVVRPELRKVLSFFANMPTEEFLARLNKSRAPGASVAIVGDSERRVPRLSLRVCRLCLMLLRWEILRRLFS